MLLRIAKGTLNKLHRSISLSVLQFVYTYSIFLKTIF